MIYCIRISTHGFFLGEVPVGFDWPIVREAFDGYSGQSLKFVFSFDFQDEFIMLLAGFDGKVTLAFKIF